MARIRSIKPEFFIDEDLQDLEAENPGAYCMLVYAGLWGHCSKDGVFEYRPRVLKLSILPFLDFPLDTTLDLLCSAGFVRRFSVEGKDYGHIPSFEKHQRISGKEAQYSPKFPTPDEEKNGLSLLGKHRGSTGEAPGEMKGSDREAQEREREKEREKEITTVVGGGSSRDSRAGAEEPPPPPSASPPVVVLEDEVSRLRDLHLATCGLSTVPPVAMIREVLARGKPVALIDDIYQAHGGDVPKYRQRNIVEDLKRLRDGVEARASPGLGKARRKSAAELRQEAIYRESRAFALGIGREREA